LPLLEEAPLAEGMEGDPLGVLGSGFTQRGRVALRKPGVPVAPTASPLGVGDRHEDRVVAKPLRVTLAKRVQRVAIGACGACRKALRGERQAAHAPGDDALEIDAPGVECRIGHQLSRVEPAALRQLFEVDQQRVARERRVGGIGRVAEGGRPQGEHLPPGLAGRGQPVDEPVRRSAEVARAVRTGQACWMHQDARGAIGFHAAPAFVLPAAASSTRLCAASVSRSPPCAGEPQFVMAAVSSRTTHAPAGKAKRQASRSAFTSNSNGRGTGPPPLAAAMRAPSVRAVGSRQASASSARPSRSNQASSIAPYVRLAARPVRRQRPQFAAQREDLRGEGDQAFVGGLPIDPGRRVVLAVGVVVAALGVAEFGAGAKHSRALREQQRGEQCALQPRAPREHYSVRGVAFRAAVPAVVRVLPVAVFLAVGEVALLLVGEQVAQREAVVGDDEVDRCGRCAAARLERIRRCAQALRELAAAARAAEPEAAHPSRKRSFHSSQRRGKCRAGSRPVHIPGSRSTGPGERRVLRDALKERRAGVETLVAARQHGREVEAKAVDLHLQRPVAQAVHHHLQHARMAQVECIAAAGRVVEHARLAGQAAVVGEVVEPAPADRRPSASVSALWL
jgi:hypothetical protein